MSGLSFESPWLLLLLPAVVAVGVLPHLWRRRMGPPA